MVRLSIQAVMLFRGPKAKGRLGGSLMKSVNSSKRNERILYY